MDDSRPTDQPAAPSRHSFWIVLALLALLLPIAILALYSQLSTPASSNTAPSASSAQQTGGMPLDDIAARLAASSQSQTTQGMHSVDDMIAQLANRLRQNPDDLQGWLMLGRSYITMGRASEAVQAFAKAYELAGEQPQLLADYAEALALANQDRMSGEPEQLALRALTLEPNNQKALWLAGVAARQKNDLPAARDYWSQLLALMPPGSNEANMLGNYLEQIGGQPPEPTVADPASLNVTVSLSPELASKTAPDETVFIFARAADGPRMPLAVARRQVGDLPVTVQLDDSSAMTPEMSLSKFAEVIVGARISRSGSATVSSGDLAGLSEPVRVEAARNVQLTIDQVVP